MPAYAVTVSVSFRSTGSATYAITLPTGVTGGAVTANKTTAVAGETITLTMTPYSGYELNTVSVYRTDNMTTTVPLSGSGNTRTFTMPAYAVTVSASFRSTGGGKYAITLPDNIAGGWVMADKTTAAPGEVVTLSFIPDEGYALKSALVHKTDDESTMVTLFGTGNTRVFTMPAYPVTVRAAFYMTGGGPGGGGSMEDSESGGGGCSVNGAGLGAIAALGAIVALRKRGGSASK
jgi:hypothetical protein